MISRYLRGARRLTVPSRGPQVPPWNLILVLEALRYPPFEPLGNVDLKCLSLKSAFLLAITSARRISELHALSIHRDCCTFSPEGSKVVLRPNPAFLLKVLSDFHLSQSMELQSLPVSAADQLAFCPVRALSEFIRRTKPLRKSGQLFVCFHTSCLGRPLSKCRLYHWVVDTIQQGYTLSGGPAPPGFEHTQPVACRLLGLCGWEPLSPPYAQQPLGPPTLRSPDST